MPYAMRFLPQQFLRPRAIWLCFFLTAVLTLVPDAPGISIPKSQQVTAAPLSRTGILAVMHRTCDYQLAKVAGQRDNDWVRSTFYTGVMALYQTTHETRYLDAALQWANLSQWTPPSPRPFFADHQCCIQTYAELAMLTHDPQKLAAVQNIYARQIASPQPKRPEWGWCDALFMAPPGWVRVSIATGDPQCTAFMNKLWWDTTDLLYDKEAHLFYRDASFFHKTTANGSKVFWSRGNGWVMAGIVRVLEYLPATDPDYPRFVALFQDISAKIASLQGSDGLWRASLLDPQEFPMPETSGTALDTYALAWGVNHGLLSRPIYLPVVKKAWTGLVGKIGAEGRLGYVQGVSNKPGPTSPHGASDYAVGGFLLAGSEMAQIVSSSSQ